MLGVDDLVESLKTEVRQNAVYLGARTRAVYDQDKVCLFDAIDEFETICRSLQPRPRRSSDPDGVSEESATRRAMVLRELAIRARAKVNPGRQDYLKGNSPFDVIDCSSCLEPFFRVDTANLECRHSLCPECLHGKFPSFWMRLIELRLALEGILSMFKVRSELKCCGQGVPVNVIRQHGGLDDDFLDNYFQWLQELHTPNPTYCPWEDCLAYIPRFHIQEDYAKCPFCKRRMCMGCKKKEHAGVCRQDKKLKALIEKGKWKFCPACGHLLDRSSGCNHMTCPCGAEFCYRCGLMWENQRAACDCGLFAALS